jgi:hypothetical protein
MSTIIGGNADRPQNIHTFPTISNSIGTTAAIEVDGITITTLEKIAGGPVSYSIQGSMNGTDWANLEDTKNKDAGNHLHTFHGFALRYLRLDVTAIQNGRSIQMIVCCD